MANLPEGFVLQACCAHFSPPSRLGCRHWQWPGSHRRCGALRQRGGHGRGRGRGALPHPKVQYLHTPDTAPSEEDRLVSILGGEASVDLITVAQAMHWFDLPAFYGVARCVLQRPGGVIAVWGYNHRMSPMEDMMARFYNTTLPYWDPRARHCIKGYQDLPFPFDDIGLGREGEPASFDMEHEMLFEGLIGMLRLWSQVTTAKKQGADLLGERVVKELEEEWGGELLVRKVTYRAFLLAGTPRVHE